MNDSSVTGLLSRLRGSVAGASGLYEPQHPLSTVSAGELAVEFWESSTAAESPQQTSLFPSQFQGDNLYWLRYTSSHEHNALAPVPGHRRWTHKRIHRRRAENPSQDPTSENSQL